MTGGIGRVVVVEPSGIVELVTGADEPGDVDPPATVPGVSTAPGVQAPTTRTRGMRMGRRRGMIFQVIDHPPLDLTHQNGHRQGSPRLDIPCFPAVTDPFLTDDGGRLSSWPPNHPVTMSRT